MNGGTSYLYAPQNRELYLKTLGESQGKSCVHSRKIFSLIDLSEEELRVNSFGKHMTECGLCQKEFLKIKKAMKCIEGSIPEQNISRESLSEIESEISKKIRQVRRTEITNFSLRLGNYRRGIQNVTLDLVSSVFSVRMAMLFVATLMGFFLIRMFN